MEVTTILPLKDKKNSTWIEFYWFKRLENSRPWKKILWWGGMVFILTILLMIQSAKQIENRVRAMPHFSIHQDGLKITRLPDWLAPFAQEITPGALPQNMTSLDHGTVSRIASAYLQNPWVMQIREISKSYPNHIHVSLILRKPAAFVFSNDELFLVDSEGVRLPGQYSEPLSMPYFLPKIIGIETRPPLPGCRWQDRELQNVLEIISCLWKGRIFDLLNLESVQIEKIPETAHKLFVLLTQDKKRIVWGPTQSSLFPCITPSQRIHALHKLYEMNVLQNQNDKIIEADIRFGYIILREIGTVRRSKRNISRHNRSIRD